MRARSITNDDLSKLMDTSDEWIIQRTGIHERRFVEVGVGTTDLALEASKRALEDAGRTTTARAGTGSPEGALRPGNLC